MVVIFYFMFLSLRDNKDQCRDGDAKKIKASSSSEPLESSSSLVSTIACHHHDSKLKKQVLLLLASIYNYFWPLTAKAVIEALQAINVSHVETIHVAPPT